MASRKPTKKKTFWETLPGVLTALTGIIVAVGTIIAAVSGLIKILDDVDFFKRATETPTASITMTTTSTPSPSFTPTITLTPLPPTFTYTPTITSTPTKTPIPPTFTPTPTATYRPKEPILVILAGPGINIRRGPGFYYRYGPAVSLQPYGSTVRILGMDPLWEWYLIDCPIDLILDSGCWVTTNEEYSNAFFASDLPIIEPPPTFTPSPTETPTPPG